MGVISRDREDRRMGREAGDIITLSHVGDKILKPPLESRLCRPRAQPTPQDLSAMTLQRTIGQPEGRACKSRHAQPLHSEGSESEVDRQEHRREVVEDPVEHEEYSRDRDRHDYGIVRVLF